MADVSLPPISWKVKVFHVIRIIVAAIFRFVAALYYGDPGEKLPRITDDILKQPAVEVATRIRTKEITSVKVLEACIRRIREVNYSVNCFVEDRFELALKEAAEADALVKSGTRTEEQLLQEKPFLGVPFTTKDSIAVKGLHQTAGVVLRRDEVAMEDAYVVKLLKEKGAIVIGLTSVPELCMWWETHNHVHGRTKNPYNSTRIVGGSSGGEGCLQAVAGSCFGIGSDIGGSIRIPAFFNGIFGHKPTWKTVFNGGLYPESESELIDSFLTVGPMTRHAVDLKPILEVIAGEMHRGLNLEAPVDIQKLKIYYKTENKAPLTDKVDPEIKKALEKVVEFFELKHKIKAEEITIERFDNSFDIWLSNMKSEIPYGTYIMKNYTFGKAIKEVVKNVMGCSANTFSALLSALSDDSGVKFGSDEYNAYLKVRQDLEEEVKNILGDDGVLLYPTHPTPAPYHNETIVKPYNFIYTAIINCLGFPATHIPLGLNREGLPIGIQVIANHKNDRLCLAVAEALDKAFGGWKEP